MCLCQCQCVCTRVRTCASMCVCYLNKFNCQRVQIHDLFLYKQCFYLSSVQLKLLPSHKNVLYKRLYFIIHAYVYFHSFLSEATDDYYYEYNPEYTTSKPTNTIHGVSSRDPDWFLEYISNNGIGSHFLMRKWATPSIMVIQSPSDQDLKNRMVTDCVVIITLNYCFM